MSNGNGCAPPPPLTADQFRAMFPEFNDPVAYPDATIEMWISLCPIDPCIWGSMYNLGQGLWTAHELKKFGPANGTGGLAQKGGPVQSKSVGPVSVSYDLTLGKEEGAGSYNNTIYGQQFIHWARLLGMGPIQVGAVTIPPYGTARSWLGPPPFPGVFG
jgi:hypothetical protein